MSDYNRTVTSSPFGRATGRTSIAIDEGLRAYMLHVYNYMVFGLDWRHSASTWLP
jgi:hypothetical protein